MKKLLLITAIFVNYLGIFAQENTLPTTGNVGIGTLNPDARLNVNGTVKIDSMLTVKDSVRIQKNLRVDQDVRFLGMTKMNDVKILGEFNSNGTTKFNGDVKFTNLEEISNLTNKYILVTTANGLTKKIPVDTLAKMFGIPHTPVIGELACAGVIVDHPNWFSAPNRIYNHCPDVKVGIGTAHPTHGLQVATDARVNGNFYVGQNISVGSLTPRTELDVIGGIHCKKFAMNIDPALMGTHFFHMKYNMPLPEYGGATIFVIENNERTLLQLNNDGALRTREIFVDAQNPWPDYVFETNYSLPKLKDVKTFISVNKHLPNVPSASEVELTGINLGEMNKILLEKVEQLTLYLIEQQERIEVLENEVKQLK